ncbi:MAG: PHP domain-containing protein, partial [Phycisphaerales bacterium]
MINYDLHIHTEHCGHAQGMTVEKILRRADELGLDTICIADHIYSPNEASVPAKIKEEAAGYETKCRVLVGAEIDVAGGYCDGRLACTVPDNLDYVIAGIHYIPGHGNFPQSPSDNSLKPDELLQRWRSTLLGVFENDKIDALAHPCRMIATSLELDLYFDAILEILRDVAPVAAETKTLWEINEHDKDKIPLSYFDKWYKVSQIALDAGVKLVYGSDSHFPEEIAQTEFVSKVLEKLPEDCLESPHTLRL